METELLQEDGGIIIRLPVSLSESLGWGAGDVVKLEIIENQIVLTRSQTAHERTMEIARELMLKYHDTLAALAKS